MSDLVRSWRVLERAAGNGKGKGVTGGFSPPRKPFTPAAAAHDPMDQPPPPARERPRSVDGVFRAPMDDEPEPHAAQAAMSADGADGDEA